MAISREARDNESKALSPLGGGLFFVAVVAYFISARVVAAGSVSNGLGIGAGILALAAIGHKLGSARHGSDRATLVLRLSAMAMAVATVGAALVKWGTSLLNSAPVPEIGTKVEAAASKLPPTVLMTGLFLLVAATAVVVAIELSSAPMRLAGYAEPRRALHGATAALTIAFAVGGVLLLNFAAKSSDKRGDYSSIAPTKLSQATIGLVQSSATDVEIFLFFEKGSPMLAEFLDFYAPLKAAGATVTALDHALDPELAQTMRISRTGTVGFRVGERTEKWFVGGERDAASRKLKRADEETRVRLGRITRDAKRIYFTVGHGERKDRKANKGERLGTESFRKIGRALNASMSKLGFVEGLGRDVPDDAALVVIFGPTTPFLAEEQESLIRYLEGGGSILVFVDPFVDAGLEKLFQKMRLKVPAGEIANDKEFIRRSHTSADHAIIFSNNFASHPTTRDLKKAGGRAAVLMLSAGHLERISGPAGEDAFGTGAPRIAMTMRSRPTSFVDLKRNRVFDDGLETRRVFNLAAAFEQKIDADRSARAVVVRDSDAFADGLIPNEANQAFAYETLGWLVRDDTVSGTLDLDADVPIRHTEEEDTLVFYGTTLATPSAIAFLGVVVLRRRRARLRAKGKAA